MKRILNIAIATMLAISAAAQTPAPPTAPLPAALASAHKLFLGNAGDQQNADCLRVYNDFYAGISNLKRFEQVTDPNQADLVLELHYEINLGQAVASNDTNHSVRQFRIVLIDPRWSKPPITRSFRKIAIRISTKPSTPCFTTSTSSSHRHPSRPQTNRKSRTR